MDRLTAEGYQNLSKTQLHVLARFDSGEMTLAQVSQRVQISVHIVSNILKMLDTGGYLKQVHQGPRIEDVTYTLIDRGHKVISIVTSEQKAVEEEWSNQLGTEELRQVIASLEELFAVTLQITRDSAN